MIFLTVFCISRLQLWRMVLQLSGDFYKIAYSNIAVRVIIAAINYTEVVKSL